MEFWSIDIVKSLPYVSRWDIWSLYVCMWVNVAAIPSKTWKRQVKNKAKL